MIKFIHEHEINSYQPMDLSDAFEKSRLKRYIATQLNYYDKIVEIKSKIERNEVSLKRNQLRVGMFEGNLK